ncbi:MAG: ABC transporter substrate-binding protein, partial [Spirochaetia bacterium]
MTRAFRTGLILVMVLAVAGYIGATGTEEATDPEEILRFALSGNPDTLDPHATSGTFTFQTIRSFYDTLVEPDRNGVLVPALAESWTVSRDNLVWRFSLRPGVMFHNGDPLTSADVKSTIERL